MIDDRAKLDTVRAVVLSKIAWLDSFSAGKNKRPDHEISARRQEVLVLRAIAEDYEGKTA